MPQFCILFCAKYTILAIAIAQCPPLNTPLIAALPLLLLFVLKRHFETQRQHGKDVLIPKRSGLSNEHFEMLAFLKAIK